MLVIEETTLVERVMVSEHFMFVEYVPQRAAARPDAGVRGSGRLRFRDQAHSTTGHSGF
jgi:hypothetical protein